MTRKSRDRIIIEGLDALRAFHGHVAFCPECSPVMEVAAIEGLPVSEAKILFCDEGRKTFAIAFKKTGGKEWGVRLPNVETKSRHGGAQPRPNPEEVEKQAFAVATGATSDSDKLPGDDSSAGSGTDDPQSKSEDADASGAKAKA